MVLETLERGQKILGKDNLRPEYTSPALRYLYGELAFLHVAREFEVRKLTGYAILEGCR